ncbi:MAG TPA: SIMPL domain-containing protein [Acidothermaceae bacterium]|nr:SIMPL domain-containing protein [Acidothermaceae bacterium]
MSLNPAVRSVAVGVAAALIVVAAYAWGHGTKASAAPVVTGPATTVPAVLTAAPASSAPSGVSSGGGISVSGTGQVTGTPNLLRLDSSISVTRPTVTAAMQDANTVMAAVQQKLKSDGVAAADLQTSGLSVQPNYTYANNTQRLTGYQVSENLSVVLRDLSKAGSIISDAAQVGGDALQISGASLDIDKDDALIASARQAAFADALAKAKTYADAAGRTLGAVTSISESTDSQPVTFDYRMASAAAAPSGAPVPIQAGSQDVTVNVAVTWALN